jgi:hypothetical protein
MKIKITTEDAFVKETRGIGLGDELEVISSGESYDKGKGICHLVESKIKGATSIVIYQNECKVIEK